MKTLIPKLLIAACAAAGISAASAQTTNLIFGTDFEGNGNYSFSYGYAFAGGNLGGAANGFAGSVAAGVGVANSSAFDGRPDFTAARSSAETSARLASSRSESFRPRWALLMTSSKLSSSGMRAMGGASEAGRAQWAKEKLQFPTAKFQ